MSQAIDENHRDVDVADNSIRAAGKSSRRIWKWIGAAAAVLVAVVVIGQKSIRFQLLAGYQGVNLAELEGFQRTKLDLLATGLRPHPQTDEELEELAGLSLPIQSFCAVQTDSTGQPEIDWIDVTYPDTRFLCVIRTVDHRGRTEATQMLETGEIPSGLPVSIRRDPDLSHGVPLLVVEVGRSPASQERLFYALRRDRMSLVRVENPADHSLIRGKVPIPFDDRFAAGPIPGGLSSTDVPESAAQSWVSLALYDTLSVDEVLRQLNGNNPVARLDALSFVAAWASSDSHHQPWMDRYSATDAIRAVVVDLLSRRDVNRSLRTLSRSSDPWVRESALLAIDKLEKRRARKDLTIDL